MHIDLNCDMGEIPEQIADGTQESLMRSITSVNIACGGHAGDEAMMRTTIEQALRWNLTIGAHPGYPDRENFGRLEMDMPLGEVASTVFEQVRRLVEIAATYATAIVHVKPHGALYNQAVNKPALARAIAEGVARLNKDVVLVGLAGAGWSRSRGALYNQAVNKPALARAIAEGVARLNKDVCGAGRRCWGCFGTRDSKWRRRRSRTGDMSRMGRYGRASLKMR